MVELFFQNLEETLKWCPNVPWTSLVLPGQCVITLNKVVFTQWMKEEASYMA